MHYGYLPGALPLRGQVVSMNMPTENDSRDTWRSRIGPMAILWVGIGIAAGCGLAQPSDGIAGLVAGIVAGVVVLVPVGLLLSLLGARWRESLIVGAIGQLFGLVASNFVASSSPRLLASQGLIFGALLGSTAVGFFYRLPRLIFGRRAVYS